MIKVLFQNNELKQLAVKRNAEDCLENILKSNEIEYVIFLTMTPVLLLSVFFLYLSKDCILAVFKKNDSI